MTIFAIRPEPLELPLKRRFTISRGERDKVSNVLVRIEAEGITGTGEAAPNIRYGETQSSALAFVRSLGKYHAENPYDIDALVTCMSGLDSGEFAAKAGVEMAMYDWIGKKLNLPLYKILQAPGRTGPKTSYTIGIDTPEIIKEKVAEAEKYPILKIKLGGKNDKEIIHTIRELTDKPLIVDANEGWTTLEYALEMIRHLHDRGIFMVEQPMPAACIREMRILKSKSPVPLIADESVAGSELDPDLSCCFHGINVKLMKTGAISTSLRLIHQARKNGLQIMVGCMLESAIADTASALVALWADYADIDGHLLVERNPYHGLEVLPGGYIQLKNLPGLGLVRSAEI